MRTRRQRRRRLDAGFGGGSSGEGGANLRQVGGAVVGAHEREQRLAASTSERCLVHTVASERLGSSLDLGVSHHGLDSCPSAQQAAAALALAPASAAAADRKSVVQ